MELNLLNIQNYLEKELKKDFKIFKTNYSIIMINENKNVLYISWVNEKLLLILLKIENEIDHIIESFEEINFMKNNQIVSKINKNYNSKNLIINLNDNNLIALLNTFIIKSYSIPLKSLKIIISDIINKNKNFVLDENLIEIKFLFNNLIYSKEKENDILFFDSETSARLFYYNNIDNKILKYFIIKNFIFIYYKNLQIWKNYNLNTKSLGGNSLNNYPLNYKEYLNFGKLILVLEVKPILFYLNEDNEFEDLLLIKNTKENYINYEQTLDGNILILKINTGKETNLKLYDINSGKRLFIELFNGYDYIINSFIYEKKINSYVIKYDNNNYLFLDKDTLTYNYLNSTYNKIVNYEIIDEYDAIKISINTKYNTHYYNINNSQRFLKSYKITSTLIYKEYNLLIFEINSDYFKIFNLSTKENISKKFNKINNFKIYKKFYSLKAKNKDKKNYYELLDFNHNKLFNYSDSFIEFFNINKNMLIAKLNNGFYKFYDLNLMNEIFENDLIVKYEEINNNIIYIKNNENFIKVYSLITKEILLNNEYKKLIKHKNYLFLKEKSNTYILYDIIRFEIIFKNIENFNILDKFYYFQINLNKNNGYIYNYEQNKVILDGINIHINEIIKIINFKKMNENGIQEEYIYEINTNEFNKI